jgi:hypothetical protein
MSKKERDQKEKSPKESRINEIALQVSTALQHLKEELGEKKFEKRTRKAAKLFVDGLKLDTVKKPAVKKGPVKKITLKKAAKKTAVKKNAAAPSKK